MRHAYLFEARSIQNYLFATGKLRDMLAGSELVDYICSQGGYLDQVLEGLQLQYEVVRKAGGAFYLVFNSSEDAHRMQATWRFATSQWMPGLECVDAIGEGASIRSAVEEGLQLLHQQRNVVRAKLPRPGPLSERSARTGQAAVVMGKATDMEALDLATSVLRKFQESDSVSDRFLPGKKVHWPNNFEEDAHHSVRFPLGGQRYVGLLHADGNGLGELLRIFNTSCKKANDATYLKLFREFSDGLTEVTLEAAKQATESELLPYVERHVMPARPLVLGGDDLSILLRADLALPFAQKFLWAFEELSRGLVSRLREGFQAEGLELSKDFPECLTACAGITIMKCSQPFLRAYELAEGLCGRAKNVSRSLRKEERGMMPSLVAFLKVQDSLLENAQEVFSQSRSTVHGRDRWNTGLPAYAIRSGLGVPGLHELNDLLKVFMDKEHGLNDRPLRELATLVHVSLGEAKQIYRRWREVSVERQPQQMKTFEKLLCSMLSQQVNDLPFSSRSNVKDEGQEYDSPLDDLLSLLSVQLPEVKNREVI